MSTELRPVNFLPQFDKLSQAWLTALPGPLTSIAGPHFQQAMAWRLCIPSPALQHLQGVPVGSEGAMMDPHGDNLMCARLPGDTWRIKHDLVKLALSNFCHEARLVVDVEVFGLFSHLIPTLATSADGSLSRIRERQALIPDFNLHLQNPSGLPTETLADVKGINAGLTWYKSRD